MCAINGFTWQNKELVQKMNEATKHRGPDGTAVYIDPHVSLGHNRLSIIDPDPRSNQPMESASGRFVITYNGELYNFKDLKKRLTAYPYKTESDTEVILAAWERWGVGSLRHLNGMFAFAIWDKKKRELFLVRDPMGIKPLYYFFDGKRLIFSSEIKGILAHDVPRKLNINAFAHYFRVEYAPYPETFFENIKKLPQSHVARFRDGELFVTRYEPLPSLHDTPLRRAETRRELKQAVFEAVERQLVSDKPLGVYLSGGIDSSSVLAAMTKRHGGGIDTFSIGFSLGEEEERAKFNADFGLARTTAKHFGANHHEVLISSDDAVDLFEQAATQLDEPVANPTAIVQLKLAKFAKEKVDVVLSGDGGDELFGGYERYRLSRAASVYQAITPNLLRDRLAAFDTLRKLNIPPGVERYAHFLFLKDKELQDILAPEFINERAKQLFERRYFSNVSESDFETQFMAADRDAWLVDESLVRSDKMSMAFGLENRVPLLDLELVALAESLPLSCKVTPFQTKIVFKKAFRGELPAELFRQPKRGWFSPAAKWLRHERFAAYARAVLSPDFYPETKLLFQWDGVSGVLEDHLARRRYNLTPLWMLLTFQLWARSYGARL